MKYRIIQIKQWICDLFAPKQKWLTKKIPRHWSDKPELIRDILFECLVHYIEEEKAFDNLDWDWSDEVEAGHISQKEADATNKAREELEWAYVYIKSDRPDKKAYENDLLEKAFEWAYVYIKSDRPDKKAYENDLHDKAFEGVDFFDTIPKKHEAILDESVKIENYISEHDQKALNIIIKHYERLWV